MKNSGDSTFARIIFDEALDEFLMQNFFYEMSEIKKLNDLELFRFILNESKKLLNVEKIHFILKYCPKATKRYNLEQYRYTIEQDVSEVYNFIFDYIRMKEKENDK